MEISLPFLFKILRLRHFDIEIAGIISYQFLDSLTVTSSDLDHLSTLAYLLIKFLPNNMPKDFIETRLDALADIDNNVIQLLESIGSVLHTYSEPSRQNNNATEMKETFENGVRDVYSLLSSVAISLRNEIKVMDDNIGVFDRNEDLVMILPISVEQKNTTLGIRKQKQEFEKLKKRDASQGATETI